MCANGEYPVQKDAAEALKWARRAADAGSPEGMTLVGLAYLKGEGTDKDSAQAARWFRRAAERDDVPAMRNLASLYREGDGVSRNLDESQRWLNRAEAAEHGQGVSVVHGPVIHSPAATQRPRR